MSDELSELNFADDLAALEGAPDADRWHIERPQALELMVLLYPLSQPDEKFLARLVWETYPGSLPPSVKFVDPETKRTDIVSAWPNANGFRPSSFDICANWAREGYTAHPEWVRDPSTRWHINGNAMLAVVRVLQHELDHSFTGRARQ